MSGILTSAGETSGKRRALLVFPKTGQRCHHLVGQPCLNDLIMEHKCDSITHNTTFQHESDLSGWSCSRLLPPALGSTPSGAERLSLCRPHQL